MGAQDTLTPRPPAAPAPPTLPPTPYPHKHVLHTRSTPHPHSHITAQFTSTNLIPVDITQPHPCKKPSGGSGVWVTVYKADQSLTFTGHVCQNSLYCVQCLRFVHFAM